MEFNTSFPNTACCAGPQTLRQSVSNYGQAHLQETSSVVHCNSFNPDVLRRTTEITFSMSRTACLKW